MLCVKIQKYEYIDVYTDKETWLKYVDDYLMVYIESKNEKNREESLNNNTMMVNWYNVQEKIQENSKNKGGGYPKSWRLRKRKKV